MKFFAVINCLATGPGVGPGSRLMNRMTVRKLTNPGGGYAPDG